MYILDAKRYILSETIRTWPKVDTMNCFTCFLSPVTYSVWRQASGVLPLPIDLFD